jgi:hypothetical protein
MGWSSIPRSLGDFADNDLIKSLIQILEEIINTGIFP